MSGFSSECGRILLSMARKAVEEYVYDGRTLEFEAPSEPELSESRGLFVTLKINGLLRGCIGYITGFEPLYKAVSSLAVSSASRDPRFRPVTRREMKDIRIEISVMSEPRLEKKPYNIIMGRHGVIVRKGDRQGVYLPQVAAETGWSRDEFLDSLCESKAGLPKDSWRSGAADIYTFTADVFSEDDNLEM
ncbi:MAG: AmmeMemoRadiSam system protein A [bacterium]|nr:AmmeMemoRadiSam system protein A [bacterium]